MIHDTSADTIAAISTAPGVGAVSVIRISGPETFPILSRIVKFKKSTRPPAARLRRADVFIPGENELLDSALVALFPAPHSYTGENMAEIHAHGGLFVTHRILELVIASGARQAVRGEFTMRAFVAGKMDLTQAEAVLDIINAQNQFSLDSAIRNLRGELSLKIRRLRKRLVDMLSRIEVVFEYPDEDVPDVPQNEIDSELRDILSSLTNLINSYKSTNEGLKIALTGRPNVGKSSLMNRLIGKDRSIIHESPGTTRDLVGDYRIIAGINILFMDTAGITHASDPIEAEGVKRTKEFIKDSDYILFLLDASESIQQQDMDIFDYIENSRINYSVILNKTDLPQIVDDINIKNRFGDCLKLSALTGQGMESLEAQLENFAKAASEDFSETILTNRRHRDLLENAAHAILAALDNINIPQDILTIDIRKSADLMGQITGESISDDILSNIFNNFCVGK